MPRIGLVGEPNSGKSYSRRNLNPEEVVILSPSIKLMHLSKAGKPLDKLYIAGKDGLDVTQKIIKSIVKDPNQQFKILEKHESHQVNFLLKSDAVRKKLMEGEWSLKGNRMVVRDFNMIETYLNCVSKYMPHIKIVIIPDFTHFFTEVLSKKEFIQRKSGGEAYQRFWELAGDAARNLLLSVDYLRENLFVVTEFHSIFDNVTEEYKIFVPAGKMLEEKFKPDSYFDFLFYTHKIKNEESGEVDRYVLVTRTIGHYSARSNNLFKEAYIDNDLKQVIEKIKDYQGV